MFRVIDGLDILFGSGKGSGLLTFLRGWEGDGAAAAHAWADALEGAATSENLGILKEVIPKELANIAHGDIDPRDSPSGAI